MPANLNKPFDPSCCDGGASSLVTNSARSCGCDPGANWVCEYHTRPSLNGIMKCGSCGQMNCSCDHRLAEDITLKSSNANPKDVIGSNKLPLSFVPASTKAYLALGHAEGHTKYGYVNWREAGVRAKIYIDALNRHIDKWMEGEEEDPKTKVPHLANAITCLSIIIDAKECGKLIDDRPKSAPVSDLLERFAEKVVHLKKLFGDAKPLDFFVDGPKKRE